MHIERFLCSQTVALELRGVPAVYFHSLTSTRNNYAGVEETGRVRTINRYKWNEDELQSRLAKPRSPTARIMKEYLHRLHIRSQYKVFHPDAAQTVIDLGPELFVVKREWKQEKVICISNFTDRYMEFRSDDGLPELHESRACSDMLTGQRYMGEGKVIALNAYQTVWLLF